MGARGPAPKRDAERRRRNKKNTTKGKSGVKAEKAKTDATSELAEGQEKPNSQWHPVAKKWYVSLATSGQHEFYEPSDWAVAYLIAESISRDLKPQVVGITDSGKVVKSSIPMKGASLAAYLKAMTALMVTEGDRRRAGLELEREAAKPPPKPARVRSLDEYRKRAAG